MSNLRLQPDWQRQRHLPRMRQPRVPTLPAFVSNTQGPPRARPTKHPLTTPLIAAGGSPGLRSCLAQNRSLPTSRPRITLSPALSPSPNPLPTPPPSLSPTPLPISPSPCLLVSLSAAPRRRCSNKDVSTSQNHPRFQPKNAPHATFETYVSPLPLPIHAQQRRKYSTLN